MTRPLKRIIQTVAAVSILMLVLAACAETDAGDTPDAASESTPSPQTAGAAENGSGQIDVAVSLPVFTSMVEAVGGDRISVRPIVPKGADAHTYQPSPSDARAIADADMIFVNGVGLEEWLDGLIDSAGGTDAPVYEMAEGLDPSDGDHDHEHEHEESHDQDEDHDHDHDGTPGTEDGHEHDDEHGHSEGNPHFWLAPDYAIHYVERIRDGLSEQDPDGADVYAENATNYITQLEDFDEWAQAEMATIPEENRKLVTFHDAFPYFADHYGIEVAGVVVVSPGREPSPQELAQLVNEIQAENVPAVFIEPQFNPRLAETLADEAGIQVQMLYSDSPEEGDNYLDMMRKNVENVVEGLSS